MESREIGQEKKQLSKSQKRHQKKIQKNKERKEKRIIKQKEEQRLSELNGKLIEENHNGGPYSKEFTEKAEKYYVTNLVNIFRNSPDKFYFVFQTLRPKLQTLILKWSDDYKRNGSFFFLVDLITLYREGEDITVYMNDVLSGKLKPKIFKKEYKTLWKEIHDHV